MEDGWDIWAFFLIGWFLWSDICGGVRWWGCCAQESESLDRSTSALLANWAILSSFKFTKPLFPHHVMGARVMPTSKGFGETQHRKYSSAIDRLGKGCRSYSKMWEYMSVKLFFCIKQIWLCCEIMVDFFPSSYFSVFQISYYQKNKDFH